MASSSISASMAATIQCAEDLATSSNLERQYHLRIAFASHRLNLVCKVFRTLTAVRRSGWQRILKVCVMIKDSPAAQGALYTEGATPPGCLYAIAKQAADLVIKHKKAETYGLPI